MGEKLVGIRQPDRNDDAARPVDPEKARAPRLWSEFCSRGFPSSTQDACGLRGSSRRTQKAMFQMALVHRNHVIQQISSAAFNPTLRYTILPRAFEGRSYRAQLEDRTATGTSSPYFASRRVLVEEQLVLLLRLWRHRLCTGRCVLALRCTAQRRQDRRTHNRVSVACLAICA